MKALSISSLLLPAILSLGLSAVGTAQTNVGLQVRVDTATGFAPGNETTMGASEAAPLTIVAGWNDYREGPPRTGVGLSTDGGATWTDFILRPPVPFQSVGAEGDPMTAFCNRTGTIWAGGISFDANGGMFVARKDPSDATFQPAVMARISGVADKGWMAAGPVPGMPDQTHLYMAYNEGLILSSDMGSTWTDPASLGPGLGFLPKVGPGGELYIAYWDFSGSGDAHRIIRSFDGGSTLLPPVLVAQRMDVWGIDGSRFPGDYRVASLQGLAVDPNSGVLYFVYPDTTELSGGNSNVDIYFTTSSDQGATWSVPVVINDDALTPGDQFFPWIEVDRNGRIHMVFNDTRNNAQDDSDPQGLIDGYYSFSDDGGASWTEVRLTNTAFDSADDGFGGLFVGDYLGLSTAGARTLPFYCASSPVTATDVFTHVITDGPATNYCMGIECPCANDDPDAGCGNDGFDGDASTGALASASGTNVLANDDLVITVDGVRSGASGLIFAGPNQISPSFGDGRRCVGGSVLSYPVRAANAGGELAYGPSEVASLPVASGVFTVGSTWHFQGWFRDPTGPCGAGFNTSNALSVVWQ